MTSSNGKTAAHPPRILYIDMAYTLKMVNERDLHQEFASRECGGYFEHVWGVHPLANVAEQRRPAYRGFIVTKNEFSERQTILEGESVYYSWLKFFFPLNFFVSQIKFTASLIKLVRKEHIGIVIAIDPYFSGLMGLAIKKFTKAKLAIWVCGNFDEIYEATGVPAMPRLFRKRWVEKIIEKRVLRSADLVVGGNQNNLEFALKNGASVNKSTVFPVGKLIHRQHLIDPVNREKDIIFTESKASYHFIYVGRLLDIKYPDDVLKAFSIIHSKEPDTALIIAGDGPMSEEMHKLAEELMIKDKVVFLGNISQLRLANILAGCFAVLSPLTGRSLIEATLAGLPIVAYDRDWQHAFVTKNGAGIVVEFRDWQKMGEEAVYLIQNPAAAVKMAQASRKTGLEASDNESLYGHERQEFEKLLKAGS